MSLPSGYKRLEYIKSSGTQYVDTGFRPNQDSTVEVTFETTQSAKCGVAVTDQAWQSNEFGIWANCVAYGSQTDQTVVFYGIGKVTARLDRNKLYKNGELIWTASAATFSCPSNLTLMALNRNGTIQEKTAGNWYSSKIYDNGTLIRDYIPCQTTAGEVGLWDDVNSVFYGNAGTGTFTAGPVMEPPEAPANLQHLLAVRFTWSAVDGATKYNVYRDDTLLGTTTGLFYVDDTAAENTEYTYAVSAVGPGGESAKTTLTVYTKSGYFLYKPYVESATFQ